MVSAGPERMFGARRFCCVFKDTLHATAPIRTNSQCEMQPLQPVLGSGRTGCHASDIAPLQALSPRLLTVSSRSARPPVDVSHENKNSKSCDAFLASRGAAAVIQDLNSEDEMY